VADLAGQADLVAETVNRLFVGSGVAHSLQNLESEGLSVWQEGHFMDASFAFPLLAQSITKKAVRVNNPRLPFSSYLKAREIGQ
jgi:hypothetical protein